MKKILMMPVMGILLLAALPSMALAATFSLKGSAGAFPPQFEVLPTAVGPIALDISNTLTGPRSSTASGFVDSGIVQVAAQSQVSAGTPSIGDIRAEMKGSWTDSLTFAAPEDIPSLPGVTIINGTTLGTADLVIFITGSFTGGAGDAGGFSSGYSARLEYGPLGFEAGAGVGFAPAARLSGQQVAFSPPSGDLLPAALILPVEFIYGDAFDVNFSLSVFASLGFEGTANADFFADALLNESAIWGGVENVQATVPADGGGDMIISLPELNWSVTSPTFDYTSAITVVPVPAAVWLLSSALGLLGWLRRKAT